MAKQVKIKKKIGEFRPYEEREGRFKYIGARRREKLWDIGLVASQISQVALRKKSPLFVRLSMEWENFVGAALAKTTQPSKLHQNVLTVKCQGPAAMELQYLIPQLLKRLNETCGLYGDQALTRIKILQDVRTSVPQNFGLSSTSKPFLKKIENNKKALLSEELDKIESESLKAIFQKFISKL
ncbi:DUF721 domain-containing protein [Acetobacteraceae bacterium]|nr:DUF721 domain-containing protein [Acetobacteraceae bacterium]